MSFSLRMTEGQESQLKKHLFPGDGKEAVAIALCGRLCTANNTVFLVNQIHLIPHGLCVREEGYLKWPVNNIIHMIEKAEKAGLAIMKIHSHPGGHPGFSELDNRADKELFESVFSWLDSEKPHISTIMLPNRIFGRVIHDDMSTQSLSRVSVIGSTLKAWDNSENPKTNVPEYLMRQEQLFGKATTRALSGLRVGVVGCSGTGGPVIEQLFRLGVKNIVLVDPDKIEEKNLNRIICSRLDDVKKQKHKTDIFKDYIKGVGLGTKINTHSSSLFDRRVIESIAECDFVFGCMDSIDGRHLLNRLTTFYLVPYIDVGVRLIADGAGGIEQICGSVHYLKPGGSSLLSRGVFTLENIRSANMQRTDPERYKNQLKEGYIKNANEDSPAVISINMLYASFAVNDFLSRIHPFKDDGNENLSFMYSLTQNEIYSRENSEPCKALLKYVGRGDIEPLLDMPELSKQQGH